MPRKAPDNVTEHRLTLGNFERTEIKQTLDQMQMLSGLNIAVIAAGLGFAGYAIYKIFNFSLFDELSDGQRSIIDRMKGLRGDGYNPDEPLWSLFGVPTDKGSLKVLYEQNQQLLAERLTKAEGFIELYNNSPVKWPLTAVYVSEMEYINTGHKEAVDALERWYAHYNESLGSMPFKS